MDKKNLIIKMASRAIAAALTCLIMEILKEIKENDLSY